MNPVLSHAIKLLMDNADCLEESSTIPGTKTWVTKDDEITHRDYSNTIGALSKLSVIDWVPVGKELPDIDTTVMIHNASWDESVAMGWLDGDLWRTLEGAALNGNPKREPDFAPPTHWAHIPKGPEDQA